MGLILVVSALASLPVNLLLTAAASGGVAQEQLMRLTQRALILSVVIQIAVGIAVVVWADRITNLIESDTAAIQIDASITELQRLGFALVGVYFLVAGLQNAASAGYVLLTKPTFDDADALTYTWDRQKEAIIRGLVGVVSGVLLVLGRQAVADGWSRLRGQSSADDDDHFEDHSG